ncbi:MULTISPECIES: MFS transporter [unclassified Streptomyces]|uniref:MFS transporter n=1 Tax=unclassified Streptomyces TaxID=2593676 RepID=UPI002E11FF5F|nr:MFS transporter [Streptomyces sp. NBC_01186]WSS40819.1 MFS transporter [Streptomyces sp. NBC_01187]
MATATGLSCAGNYFAQPLLDLITRDLHISSTLAGLIVTASQLGYALGLLLIVPLGDVLDRRRLAVTLMAATALFLALTAAAPNGPALLAGTVAVALTAVGAQVVVGYAAALVPDAARGQAVATVMSGILLGGLLARTVSGALATLGGWRTVYWVSAIPVAVMALLLHRFLPRVRPTARLSYPALLRSSFSLLREVPLLRRRSALSALAFASYSGQITAVTFLLARPPFGWSEGEIGLVGLLGVIGVLAMTFAGRLNDRGHVQHVTGFGILTLGGGWLLMLAGERSLPWLALGVVALNIGQQAVLNSSQTVLYALRPEARNRLNSVFMTSFFIGGATGSALTAVIWARGGWSGVCALGAALAAGALALWALERIAAARA